MFQGRQFQKRRNSWNDWISLSQILKRKFPKLHKSAKIFKKFDNIISHIVIAVKVLPNFAGLCIDTQFSLSVTERECEAKVFRVYRHGKNRYFLILLSVRKI